MATLPYNYSDMTGFNVRTVNPGLPPLKGYWSVIHDCGVASEIWKSVSWNAALTNGCSVEVFVRASNDRLALANEIFVPAMNEVALAEQLRGRFIEIRLALTRDNASKQPAIYDVTLHGMSSGFNTDALLNDVSADETQNAVFTPNLVGAGTLSYQWFMQYPWTNEWALVPGATNASFTLTNVDSFVDWSLVRVLASNVIGEVLWLGPAELFVSAVPIDLPATNYSTGTGPASVYPKTINVFGQPTNMASVTVELDGLSHTHSADLDILLVSPTDKRIMLMSHVGGTNGVSYAILVFKQGLSLPPSSGPIPSSQASYYGSSNFGSVTNMPGAPVGPYSTDLGSLNGDNPNGVWKLYIYDDHQSKLGALSGSWQLKDFTFQ
jgi:subtilisin-like proprotein convertase family protein